MKVSEGPDGNCKKSLRLIHGEAAVDKPVGARERGDARRESLRCNLVLTRVSRTDPERLAQGIQKLHFEDAGHF